MASPATNSKQQAHELIERLSSGQVSAVVNLLEAMLDPVSVALASAPMDDEPVSEEEASDVAEARTAIARGSVVSNEEVLSEFGLTAGILSAWDEPRSNQNPILRRGDCGAPEDRLAGQAKAQLRAIEQPTALRILHALAHFVATGEGDVKRLQDTEPPGIGDYRLRFHDDGYTLYVTAVKHRREAYR